MDDSEALLGGPEGYPDVHVDPPDPLPGLLLDDSDAHALGPATVDSDADGRADTAVGTVGDALVLGTDLDGDTRVDILTTLGADGSAVTRTVPPPDPGTAQDEGARDEGVWDEGVAPPAPTIDPVTGRWIRGD